MKLLLDEMISPAIARELRDKGFEVQAINGDRMELKATPDVDIVRRIHAEQRAIVTNNVADFRPIHTRFMAQGEAHSGMVFTWDASLPRSKASIPLWVDSLEGLLEVNPAEDASRNRVMHLP